MDKRLVLELCRGRDINSLPPEVRELVAGDEEARSQEGSHRIHTPEEATKDLSRLQQTVVQDPVVQDVVMQTEEGGVTAQSLLPIETSHRFTLEVLDSSLVGEPTPQEIWNDLNNSPTQAGVDKDEAAMSALKGKAVAEPSPNQPRKRSKDKKTQSWRQPRTDNGPSKGRVYSGIRLLKRGEENVTPGGQHVLRPSTLWRRSVVLSRGESSRRSQPKKNGLQNGPSKSKGVSFKKTQVKEMEKKKAQLEFNPEGFFEVKVDFKHCVNIAEACGIKVDQISKILEEDNANRATMPIQQQLLQEREEILVEVEQARGIAGLDPNLEDESSLGSD